MSDVDEPARRHSERVKPLHTFAQLERVEWDTLMFFYGVMLAVGGLGILGYLALTSRLLYEGLGPTAANVLIGVVSAAIDNVPVMFAVLSMEPHMSRGQWLLVTLTVGVGGSLLSFGSAAGVALMGHARGAYTFLSHLRWSWAIGLGYVASIGVHLVLNQHLF
jgi:Na+/H+ antiporter NhaD/arsenite permease-like protein